MGCRYTTSADVTSVTMAIVARPVLLRPTRYAGVINLLLSHHARTETHQRPPRRGIARRAVVHLSVARRPEDGTPGFVSACPEQAEQRGPLDARVHERYSQTTPANWAFRDTLSSMPYDSVAV